MAERKRFLLRIRPELWDELNRWASQEFRSVNGQIEFLLQRAVQERKNGRADPNDASLEDDEASGNDDG